MCVVGIQSESIRTYLSSVEGTHFCEVVQWLENTHGEPTGLLEWPAGLCLQSKITDLILSSQLPWGNKNSPLRPRIFCLWLVIGTYILLFFFFPVICWSCLWTEISVTLSIGNKLYSRHHLLLCSFLWNYFVYVILWPHWSSSTTLCH